MVEIEHISFDGLKMTLTDSGIRTILLDRLKRNNALTVQMLGDITHIINDAAIDGDKTKLLYITGGNGNYFSSGNDLQNYFPKEDIDPVTLLETAIKTFEDFVKAFINFPKLGKLRIDICIRCFLLYQDIKYLTTNVSFTNLQLKLLLE